jgi:hypothetical protein
MNPPQNPSIESVIQNVNKTLTIWYVTYLRLGNLEKFRMGGTVSFARAACQNVLNYSVKLHSEVTK